MLKKSLNNKLLPEKGFFRRMNIYLHEMFPVSQRIISSAILYLSYYAMLSFITGTEIDFISYHSILGILVVFTIKLIIRLMDELKDIDIDKELFKERPLPSGRVFESDIRYSLVISILLFCLWNIWSLESLLSSLLVLFYSFLMFKFFFIPDILRRNLLLNLSTHNPVVAVILFHLTIMYLGQNKLGIENVGAKDLILAILMYWSVFFSWEISRKIKAKADENEYVTYSMLLGKNGSITLLSISQSACFGIGFYFYLSFELSFVYLVIISLSFVVVMYKNISFIIKPNKETAKLKSPTEKFGLTMMLASIIELLLNEVI